MYHILSSKTIHDLTEQMNNAIKDEWTPVGGVCFDGKHYLQAMTKQ